MYAVHRMLEHLKAALPAVKANVDLPPKAGCGCVRRSLVVVQKNKFQVSATLMEE